MGEKERKRNSRASSPRRSLPLRCGEKTGGAREYQHCVARASTRIFLLASAPGKYECFTVYTRGRGIGGKIEICRCHASVHLCLLSENDNSPFFYNQAIVEKNKKGGIASKCRTNYLLHIK